MSRAGALAALLIAAAPATAQAAAPAWSFAVSGVGFGLMLTSPDQGYLLGLSCVRGARQVTVILPQIKPVGTDDRLTLSLDRDVFPFVVKRQSLKDGKVVEAAATTTPLLLKAIETAATLRGSYAGKAIGPYPAPPASMTRSFNAACGALI